MYSERKAEIENLKQVFPFDGSLRLALRICRIASSLHHRQWKTIIDLLRPFIEDWEKSARGHQLVRLAVDRDLTSDPYQQEKLETDLRALADPEHAQALMRYGQASWATAETEDQKTKARRYLGLSGLLDAGLADAPVALGDTFRDEKRWDKALECYERAITATSSSTTVNPRIWRKFLVAKIIVEGSLAFVPALTPALDSAIEVCRKRARIKVYLPQAYFDIGFFYLALGRPYEALAAYARAVTLCEFGSQVLSPYRQLLEIQGCLAKRGRTTAIESITWAIQLLALALHAKSNKGLTGGLLPSLEELRTRIQGEFLHIPTDQQILIVAGGTLASEKEKIEAYSPLLKKALAGFDGVIFCGGTTSGISGLVGRLAMTSRKTRRISYLPRETPEWTSRDSKHYELFPTEGSSFSPREPLQNWIDLLASGVDPSKVRLIGISGGPIAGVEYRLALALGAKVGVFAESGRAATGILRDEDWADVPGLSSLPKDTHTLAEFVREAPSQQGLLGARYRQREAMKEHEDYRRGRLKDFAGNDPTLRPWKDLPEHYKRSNLGRIDHFVLKLQAVGMKMEKCQEPAAKKVIFTQDQLEFLAAMEHGRWNAEKLLDGWKWAEETDKNGKRHKLLVPWSELPAHAKKWDIDPLVALLGDLQKQGFAVKPADREHDFFPVDSSNSVLFYILPVKRSRHDGRVVPMSRYDAGARKKKRERARPGLRPRA
jgi:tetratricopeptide (TPR) repeat protein